MPSITTHPKMLDEILSVLNDQHKDDIVQSLRACFHIPFFLDYIKLNICEEWSDIDYDKIQIREYNYHRSMSGTYLLNRHTFKIIESCLLNDALDDKSKINKFTSLAEMLYKDEYIILKAVMNKNLTNVYPNLTFEKLCEAVNQTL